MTENVNENAILYDNHQVDYPQHERRRYWIEISKRGNIVIRDHPDGPVPCRWEHDGCVFNE